jgi:hypothetical protein
VETVMLLVTALPWLAVWLVAGIVAAITWSRHPPVSVLVVTAAALNTVAIVAGRVLPLMMRDQGWSAAHFGMVSTAFGFLSLVASVCMVVAVFLGRSAPRQGAAG